jgi:truncated hemoglobin YjbI
MNNSPPEQQSPGRTQTRLERRQWLKDFALALALIVFTVAAASELAGLVRNGAIRW